MAATLLMEGKIQKFTWSWAEMGILMQDSIIPMAIRLFSIPYVEEEDKDKGFEFRRLLKSENRLNRHDPLDGWAIECLGRPKHQFKVGVNNREYILTLTRA
jgi:hypothetical protein